MLRVRQLIDDALAADATLSISRAMICELNHLAVDGLVDDAGAFRSRDVVIAGSVHEPPRWQDVPRLVDELCIYLDAGPNRDPLHLGAYALWRLNWIHPFNDGNGRTSRALAQIVLSVAFRQKLHGQLTMHEMLSVRPEIRLYREGLDAADRAWRHGAVDVTPLAELLSDLIARQIAT